MKIGLDKDIAATLVADLVCILCYIVDTSVVYVVCLSCTMCIDVET